MTFTILYVEDNPYSVRLMEMAFKRYSDYRLLIATNGQTGFEITLKQQPDLILMDINLPDITGWELTKKLRENPATQHIPIIAVTANSLEQYQQESMDAGCNAHLNKPVHHLTLLSYIKDLLSPAS